MTKIPKRSRRSNFNPDLMAKAKLLERLQQSHFAGRKVSAKEKKLQVFRRRLAISSYKIEKAIQEIERKYSGVDAAFLKKLRESVRQGFTIGSKKQILASLRDLAFPVIPLPCHL